MISKTSVLVKHFCQTITDSKKSITGDTFPFREPLKNDEMQGDEENLTELYDLYSEGRGDEVDKAVRVFQRFLSNSSKCRYNQNIQKFP